MKECDKLRERNQRHARALLRAHGIMFNSATWNWRLHLSMNARGRSGRPGPAPRQEAALLRLRAAPACRPDLAARAAPAPKSERR
ncbi:MAG: hypothetical protein M9915_04540 [Rhizobacter sp.]|nr:hypothetical protein [Rhizobacter sp.]